MLEQKNNPTRENAAGYQVELAPELYTVGRVHPSMENVPELRCDNCGERVADSPDKLRYWFRVQDGEIVACHRCAPAIAREVQR